jgi:hypothetical protein
VSVYGVAISLLLAFPWALVGVGFVGAAFSSLTRRLGRQSGPSLTAWDAVPRYRFSEAGHKQATGEVPVDLSKASSQRLPNRKAA